MPDHSGRSIAQQEWLFGAPDDSGGGTVYADNFNRAETTCPANGGTGLGPEWIAPAWQIWGTGGVAWRYISAVGGEPFGVFLHDCGPDHWAEATVTWGVAEGRVAAVNVRRSADNNSDGYMAFIDPPASGGFGSSRGLILGRNVGGTYSDLAIVPQAPENGHTIRIEAQGTTLRVYLDGTLKITHTDASVPATRHYTGVNSIPECNLDDFRCGPLPYTP